MTNKEPPLYSKPSSIANAIMMVSRSDKKKSSLLVEGSTDSKLFSKLLNCDYCFIHRAGSYKNISAKKRVIEVVKILQERTFHGFFAIVDADLEHIDEYVFSSPNLLRTDTYNIESLMLKSDALEILLTRNANSEKLKKYQEKFNVRKQLLTSTKPIGLLRLINKRNNWRMTFQHLNFEDFICKKTLTIKVEELIMSLSGINLRDFFEIEEELNKVSLKNENLWLICNGHDMMGILLIGFYFIIGDLNKNLNRYRLEDLLRSSYEISFFKETNLFSDIKKWEQANTPFRVLS